MLALIPLFPLIGFLINGIWYAFFQAPAGRKPVGAGVPGAIATLAIGASFLVSLLLFLQLHGIEQPEHRVIDTALFSWMSIGNSLNVDFSFHLDSLSTLFTLVITGVGTLIHLYSVGYMAHDATPGKFFSYLNLFCFAMLVLVLGSSLPVMFLGWEGVGLCSYLLIGYWYTDEDKAKAGKKAFIVNRIGDFGFLLGMFLLFASFGTLDFQALHQLVLHGHEAAAAMGGAIDTGMITTACLLLFVGCCGKSAQIPLFVWLPDAMAGPTPVSALIHAATMVTSGIYMLSRLNFMYNLSPTALHVVASVGVATAFFAATIALVQRDIKKILAYSTVSQLGYMFLACGVGAYSAGVFHVITHAFFKALLFLGAGSVIHGMHEEQDIMKMGGLRSRMPQTFWTFAVGWLAISGIPPFSGFFSKDEILWQSFSSPLGNALFWGLGALTALMTAFYMTRLFSLTFLGTPRFVEARSVSRSDEAELGAHHNVVAHPTLAAAQANGHGHGHGSHGGPPRSGGAGEPSELASGVPASPASKDDHGHHAAPGVHESPMAMTLPLQILAVLSAVGGVMGLPHHSWLEQWLEPVIPVHEALGGPEGTSPSMEYVLMAVSVILAIVGITFAIKLYRNLGKAEQLARANAPVYNLLENKWYIDEIYDALIVRPIHKLSELAWKVFDIGVIDRLVLGVGRVSEWTGQTVRVVQTGSIQLYGFALLLGIVVAVGYLIYGVA